ncbi:hypothetical protein [Flavobacterium sp.]|jgi:hypothetical protein|uniref:hypothetical protein n=1 Tax=Flavobacterium sp. TaxID=239 RepID=UPI0037BFF6AF
MKKILAIFLLLPMFTFAQSGLEQSLKIGELLMSGFSILKASKNDTKKDSQFITSICVKNKLMEKITFKMDGKDEHGEVVKKELVVQNDGKECVFNIPKGIYSYEVILSNKEIYKKGEYKFDEDMVISIKKED